MVTARKACVKNIKEIKWEERKWRRRGPMAVSGPVEMIGIERLAETAASLIRGV